VTAAFDSRDDFPSNTNSAKTQKRGIRFLKVIYEENRENLVTMEMEVEMEKIERMKITPDMGH
jgi:hypothetical protein